MKWVSSSTVVGRRSTLSRGLPEDRVEIALVPVELHS